MKKCDNKGTTLINVIVTCGFIGILASVIILATAGNIFIKRIDLKSKNNFYSAETIIKEIEMGLQADIAEDMVNVYDREITLGSRDNNDFKEHVINGMPAVNNGAFVNLPALDGFAKKVVTNYDEIDKKVLRKYVDSRLKPEDEQEENAPVKFITGLDNGKIRFEKLTSKGDFIIKGLKVQYKKDSYLSEISTDINIVIPAMPTKPDTNDRMIEEFKKYAIIADKSVSPLANKNYTVNGDIWVGEGDSSDKGGIQVGHSNTSVSMDTLCNRVFSQGEIKVSGQDNAKIKLGDDTHEIGTIATGGLRVASTDSNGNTGSSDNLYINGKKCIVQNDLSLDAKASKVSVKGNYYGFGNGGGGDMTKNAKASSSISVGGINSVLSMTLGTLGLEGCAYISTHKEESSDTYVGDIDGIQTGSDILTGESITIRGNQVAYLVPFKYTPFIGNPITKTEYKKYIDETKQAENKTEEQVKADIVNSIKEKLIEDPYISEYLDDDKPFITMFHKMSSTDEGSIYYYYNFDSKEKAAQYYKEQVIDNQDRQKNDKNTLAKLIPEDININASFYNIAGNYVTKVDSDKQEFEENGTEDENYATGDFSGIFSNLKAFYSEKVPFDAEDDAYDTDSSLVKPVSTKTAIENTIRYTRDVSTKKVRILGELSSYDQTLLDPDSSGKNKYNDADVWVVNNNTTPIEVENGYKGLIIAAGDVKLKGDMTGLLLTFGKVTFENGGTIKADKTMLDGLLSRAKSINTSVSGKTLADCFKLKISSTTAGGTITTKKKSLSAYDDMVVSLDGMFSYSNWKKVQDS